MKQNKSLIADVHVVSSANPPMIGNPNPNPTGVILIQPRHCWVLLACKVRFIQEFNMEYWVQQVRYDIWGGQNFYSHIIER